MWLRQVLTGAPPACLPAHCADPYLAVSRLTGRGLHEQHVLFRRLHVPDLLQGPCLGIQR